MSQPKNYYQLLHVQIDAPTEVIRSSYRALMQQLRMHPDLGGDPENAALINKAYQVLTDPYQRRQYDQEIRLNTKKESNKSYQDNAKHETSPIDIETHCPFCFTTHNLGNNIQPQSTCRKCGSTLYPVVRQKLDDYGRRFINRIPKRWPVTFYKSWPATSSYSGLTIDVSLYGMQMLTATKLQTDQVVKISSNTLEALGRIANQRAEAYGNKDGWKTGVEFLTLKFHNTQGNFVKIKT